MRGCLLFSDSKYDRRVIWSCPYYAFPAAISRMRFSGARLMFVCARPEFNEVKIDYFFEINSKICSISVITKNRSIFSAGCMFASALFFEREISTVFSVTFYTEI